MVVNGAPNNTASYRVEGLDNTNHTVGFRACRKTSPARTRCRKSRCRPAIMLQNSEQAGGGLFNITMKSGTNQYHGSGYEYFVNEDLNAAAFSIPLTTERKSSRPSQPPQ